MIRDETWGALRSAAARAGEDGWSELVRILVECPDRDLAAGLLLAYCERALASWPPGVRRPLPAAWAGITHEGLRSGLLALATARAAPPASLELTSARLRAACGCERADSIWMVHAFLVGRMEPDRAPELSLQELARYRRGLVYELVGEAGGAAGLTDELWWSALGDALAGEQWSAAQKGAARAWIEAYWQDGIARGAEIAWDRLRRLTFALPGFGAMTPLLQQLTPPPADPERTRRFARFARRLEPALWVEAAQSERERAWMRGRLVEVAVWLSDSTHLERLDALRRASERAGDRALATAAIDSVIATLKYTYRPDRGAEEQ